MDDVGQTLLNWASAFGTQEMVEFLCRKGADVNKGHRSSSLHYAACFGRPQIARDPIQCCREIHNQCSDMIFEHLTLSRIL